MDKFFSIEKESKYELVVKKSKFIANAYYVENEKDAEEKIKAIKTEINNSNFKNNSLDFDKSYVCIRLYTYDRVYKLIVNDFDLLDEMKSYESEW